MILRFWHKILSVVLLSSALFGCNYNRIKKESTHGPHGGPAVSPMALNLDFQSIQLAVIGPQCLNCHSAAGGARGGLVLENYQQVRSALSKIYYRSIEKKDMPANSLPQAQYDLLKAWLEMGAPEKNNRGPVQAIRGPISWSVIKNQVFKNSCLDCHSGKDPHGGLDFESLDVVKKNIQSIFDAVIIKQTMPLEPYAALAESEQQALMKWISQGMPE